MIDDFRESYYWLRINSKSDSKIVSWWDYGYQIAGISNRAVIVDNNTWNTTHIATVGAVFTNEEEEGSSIASDVNNENLAIKLKLSVRDSGYLKNGKVQNL